MSDLGDIVTERLNKPEWIQRLANPMGLKRFSELEIPPQEPIVDGLIYTGQLVWLSGGSGLQKSLTSMCMAKCVALGRVHV